jgi:membrane protein
MKKKILDKSKEIIRMFNILSDDREIGGNLFLWSFIKLFTNQRSLKQAAAALTYHTLFAIVPVMALFIAVTKFMGYGDAFREQVDKLFASQEGVSQYLMSFAESYLNNAQVNYWLGAAVGLTFLVYSLFSIFQTIDGSFNSLWNLPAHSLKKQLKVFVFVLMVPFVGTIALALWISISSYFATNSIFHEVNVLVLTSCLYVAVMFLAYKFIPNTKVETKYALRSAIVCGITFGLLQYFGFLIMGMFGSYRNVYGDLASLMLFILWIYFSWTICLAGSRWNYLLQEGMRLDMENKFKRVSHNYRKFITIITIDNANKLNSLFGNLIQQDLVNVMNNKYNLPAHITVGIVDELRHKGILCEDEYTDGLFFFKESIAEMSLLALVEKFDTYGDNSNAMEMTSDAHMIGKEAQLWQYINDGKCEDTAIIDSKVENF